MKVETITMCGIRWKRQEQSPDVQLCGRPVRAVSWEAESSRKKPMDWHIGTDEKLRV